MAHSTAVPYTMRATDAAASRPQPAVLVAEELRKTYGLRQALQGLSFSLRGGRILGFLGPNGAGKTTSIRILTTIMQPDSGRFEVDGIGHDRPNEIRRRIGVLPETFGLHKQLTGIEYVTYFGQLYGRSAANARAHGMKLLEEVGLGKRARSLTSTYSHGMRQRLGIARALINDPVVVFLDEPTLGLDPRGQAELLGLVKQIAKDRNAGIILCSHMLADVETICDDVVILSTGEIVASGPVSEVLGKHEKNVIRLRVPPPSVGESKIALEALATVKSVTPAGGAAGSLRVQLQEEAWDGGSHITNRILETLIRANIPILSFEPEGGRLQDVFLNLTAAAGGRK
jgi:ABC-2 type transport system ATP-binding protein